MFKIFRIILIFLTLACMILSIFGLTGSYKNESYLTNTYLLNIHLNGLDLKQIINSTNINKRDWQSTDSGNYYVNQASSILATATVGSVPSAIESWYDSQPSSVQSSIQSAIPGVGNGNGNGNGNAGYYTTVSAAINDLLENTTPQLLGIADVYSISFWGYCRGQVEEQNTNNNSSGTFVDNFDNSNINWTWCSDPTPGFFFNPVEIFKNEMNNTLNGIQVDDQSSEINQLSNQLRSELKVLLDNLTDDDFNLPGNLNDDLKKLNDLTIAGFALILTVIVLSFISLIFQLFGFCCSPNKCCLSFLNFLFEFIIFILAIVGAGLVTGVYYFVKGQINDNVEDFGIKSFLSINFYAFIWSAVVACILIIFFNLLGHCCGLFGTGRKRYRAVKKEEPHEIAYEHKDGKV
ncbi:unnamed protein product [Candida verbasci]|uniref:Uncharacterized protein n=1 Tax=Candida verbasci TaxID=1227364 RepID=A0A9W4XAG5_9ASCO|nr:unnamed protein product [Candida verbasci]